MLSVGDMPANFICSNDTLVYKIINPRISDFLFYILSVSGAHLHLVCHGKWLQIHSDPYPDVYKAFLTIQTNIWQITRLNTLFHKHRSLRWNRFSYLRGWPVVNTSPFLFQGTMIRLLSRKVWQEFVKKFVYPTPHLFFYKHVCGTK